MTDKSSAAVVRSERRGAVERYFERLFDREDQKEGMRACPKKRAARYQGR